MKNKMIKLLSLATAAASTITNQALAVVTPAESIAQPSVTEDSRKEEALADVWALQDMNGATVGVMNRPATAEDEASNFKILKHPALKGRGLLLFAALWEKDGKSSHIAWGEVLPQSYWQDLESRLVGKIEIAAQKSKPCEQVAESSHQKEISVKHPNALVTEVDVNSTTLGNLRDAGCVIFTVFPSKVTAVGVIAAEGLVLLDDMGGNRGLKYFSLGPLGPGVIVPNDPEKFAVNLGKTAVNPFQQAKVYEKILKDTVKIVPGGQGVADAMKPLRQAVQQLGNTRIAGTTPNHAISSWQSDPVEAAKKTVDSVANAQIGGTTPAKAVDSWTSNPGKAAEKTVKSLKFW